MLLIWAHVHQPRVGHNMENLVQSGSFDSVEPVLSICKLNEVDEDRDRLENLSL
jgi:hypothetical protein